MRLLFILLACALICPVQPLGATVPERPLSPSERVHLQLSERVIGTGETLWFQGTLGGDNPRSTVLYVEVLNQGGAVVQGIFAIEEGVARGQLSLPDTISGGWYQVRAYTQWMRNEGPATFATQTLLVVNPYEDQLSALGQRTAGPANAAQAVSEGDVRIALNKTSYHPREPVTIRLQLKEDAQQARVAVSVRKVSPINGSQRPSRFILEQTSSESGRYAREDDGLTLSGTVTGMDERTADRTVILFDSGNRSLLRVRLCGSAEPLSDFDQQAAPGSAGGGSADGRHYPPRTVVTRREICPRKHLRP